MGLEVRRINPLEMRTAIVDFFWAIRMWPQSSQEQYLRLWDWRNASLSESPTVAWVALDGSRVVGHTVALFRTLTLDGRPVRAALTANYRVDPAYGTTLVSGALASVPRTLVRQREVDVLLSFSTSVAHRMVVALGNRELGPMHVWAKVVRWAPILRRRGRLLPALAPVISAALRARNLVGGARAVRVPAQLEARVLSAGELATLDRSHWRHRSGLIWDGSLDAFARHFCPSEFRASRVVGILDRATARLEGLVALEGTSSLEVLECSVNESVVSAVEAVEIVVQASPGVESVRVPLLPQTALAAEFRDAGYLRVPPGRSAAVFRNTFWSAHWLKDHALAAALADTQAWNLWYGWSHH